MSQKVAAGIDPVTLHRVLYRAMLGRDVTDVELDGIKSRYKDTVLDPKDLGEEIGRSFEFHMRHREVAAEKLFPKSSVVVGRGPLGHELFLDLRQFHLGFSMALGHFEPDETDFVRSYVKRGMHVVDVGANIGYFTTIFAGLVGNSGSVVSFEPVTDTWKKLSSAVRRNNLDNIVQVFKVAASSSSGRCDVSYEVDSLNMGGVSLNVRGDKAHSIVESVETVRLDDVLSGRPVDFIKMDVEGAEGLALSGAKNIISSCKPAMMIEFNREQLARVSQTSPEELFSDILSLGYAAHVIGSGGVLEPTSGIDQRPVSNLAFLPI